MKKFFNTLMLALFVGLLFSCQNPTNTTNEVTPGWYLFKAYESLTSGDESQTTIEVESQTVQVQRIFTYEIPKHFYFYINSSGEVERAGEESEYSTEIMESYRKNNFTYSQILEICSSNEDEQGNKRLTGFIFADTPPSWAN